MGPFLTYSIAVDQVTSDWAPGEVAKEAGSIFAGSPHPEKGGGGAYPGSVQFVLGPDLLAGMETDLLA